MASAALTTLWRLPSWGARGPRGRPAVWPALDHDQSFLGGRVARRPDDHRQRVAGRPPRCLVSIGPGPRRSGRPSPSRLEVDGPRRAGPRFLQGRRNASCSPRSSGSGRKSLHWRALVPCGGGLRVVVPAGELAAGELLQAGDVLAEAAADGLEEVVRELLLPAASPGRGRPSRPSSAGARAGGRSCGRRSGSPAA